MSFSEDQLKGVAIIGMAGRFPGAKNIDEFWENLCKGVESVSFFSDEEVLDTGVDPRLLKHPDYVKAWGVMDDEELFDANFFGIPGREAEAMDPQHRHFLEVCVHALENGGYNPETYDGLIGLICGVGISTYLLRNLVPNTDHLQALGEYLTFIGNDKDFMGTRVAYKLNLRGGVHSVSTACSTTMVAVHLACRQLLTYETDMVLAGGANIKLPQKSGYLYRKGHLKSIDGRCHAFDAKARGTVFGCGVAAVLLKRAQEAVVDGDHIYGIIAASAINNDGNSKAGYTAPSVSGQTEVIAQAHELAGFHPATITHMEAHGTGTELGDPCEVKALNKVFQRNGNTRKGYCALTSVKTNIGHLDSVGGVAGLIKLALSMRHKLIPPSLNFETPNPEIDFENSPFFVNTKLREWKREGDIPLRACISAFGAGGTNAHAVLQEAPQLAPSDPGKAYHLLTLSAKTPTALAVMTANLRNHLEAHPHLPMADVCFTMNMGRMNHLHRRAVVFANRENLLAALANPDEGRDCFTGVLSGNGEARKDDAARLVAGVAADPAPTLLKGQLVQLAELWVDGASIDWYDYYKGAFHHRLPLPNYPFESVRYWIDQPKGLAVASEETVGAKSSAKKLTKQPMDRWFFEPSWQRATLVGDTYPYNPEHYWVVFADSLGLGNETAAQLRAAGKKVITVTVNHAFEKHGDDHYAIDASRADHYNGFLTELNNRGRIPAAFVHCWSVSEGLGADEQELRGFYSLIYLAQAAVMQSYSHPVRLLAVSNHVHNVLGTDTVAPAKTMLLAPVRVIPQEHPGFYCRAVDVVLNNNLADLATLLIQEANTQNEENVVALRQGRRWAQTWQQMALPEPTGNHPTLRTGATYLVTGGLGGIGGVLAEFLVERYSANLILTGRAALPERSAWDGYAKDPAADNATLRRIKKLQHLEARGGKVAYYRADSIDLAAMTQAVERAEAEVGRIDGVVHAAGLAEVGMILRKTRDAAEHVLAPKTKGSRVIAQVFEGRALDFMVMCSSLSTAVGGYGQVAYVAANTFQDAFASAHANRNFFALNWDAWKEVGMAVNRQTDDLQLKGIANIEGVQAFERALAAHLPQVAISTHDLVARVHQSRVFSVDSVAAVEEMGTSKLSYPRPEMSVPYRAPESELEKLLVRDWMHILGMERVGVDDDFFELGGDSLKGMNVVNALEKRLGEVFHIEALFDTSTIADLANYLNNEYSDAIARILGGTAPVVETKGEDSKPLTEDQFATFRAMIPKIALHKHDGPKIGPAVFILAPPRSGSTLLRVILAGHPQLVAPPELFMLPFNTAVERDQAFQGQTAFWKDGLVQTLMMVKDCGEGHARLLVEDFEQKNISIKDLYKHLQDLIHRENATRLLVDKTPSYAYDLNTLKRAEDIFHNPLYVHLQRHPHAMIKSYKNAHLDVPLRHHFGGNLPFTTQQLGELLWHTCHTNINTFLADIPAERKLAVRFEDLVANPEPEVRGLCSFLGLDFDEDMLDPYQEGYRRMTEGINTESRMLGDVKFHGFKKIEAGVADAWKGGLKQDFLGASTWALAQGMGYEVPASAAAPVKPSVENLLASVDDMDEAALDAALAMMQGQ